jgi:hypothetical protein
LLAHAIVGSWNAQDQRKKHTQNPLLHR